MNIQEIKEQLFYYTDEDRVAEYEPMDLHTSFRCGGAADLFVTPGSLGELMNVLDLVRTQKIPYLVLGNGSNVLFKDSGYHGVVIRIGEGMDRVRIEGQTVFAEPGVSLAKLAKMVAEEGLSGLEFACGIPGSLGGAVFMNAGAYDHELKEVLLSVSSINHLGMMKDRKAEDCGLGYRHSIFMDNGEVILGVKLFLKPDSRMDISDRMKEYTLRRNSKQPVHLPSAGSFFKRPEGHFAGKLIEDAGLKGLQIGGAQVSPMHAGFIVNNGGATATDVLDLMRVVQETVLDKSGVMLEPEVRIVGE
ncbi:MAG: UDP-N-acetylmuramate dehydrogenase [Firmicutes bacterium]|nr:UDP-N-acetylmuramate dehydrogenase [Bacillota bacterium]